MRFLKMFMWTLKKSSFINEDMMSTVIWDQTSQNIVLHPAVPKAVPICQKVFDVHFIRKFTWVFFPNFWKTSCLTHVAVDVVEITKLFCRNLERYVGIQRCIYEVALGLD